MKPEATNPALVKTVALYGVDCEKGGWEAWSKTEFDYENDCPKSLGFQDLRGCLNSDWDTLSKIFRTWVMCNVCVRFPLYNHRKIDNNRRPGAGSLS